MVQTNLAGQGVPPVLGYAIEPSFVFDSVEGVLSITKFDRPLATCIRLVFVGGTDKSLYKIAKQHESVGMYRSMASPLVTLIKSRDQFILEKNTS